MAFLRAKLNHLAWGVFQKPSSPVSSLAPCSQRVLPITVPHTHPTQTSSNRILPPTSAWDRAWKTQCLAEKMLSRCSLGGQVGGRMVWKSKREHKMEDTAPKKTQACLKITANNLNGISGNLVLLCQTHLRFLKKRQVQQWGNFIAAWMSIRKGIYQLLADSEFYSLFSTYLLFLKLTWVLLLATYSPSLLRLQHSSLSSSLQLNP